MANQVHERLKSRIKMKGLSWEGAAKEAKLDRSYFTKLFSRDDSIPRGQTLSKIAKALDVTEGWILTGADAVAPSDAVPAAGAPPMPARLTMPNDVPVRGTAAGSHARGAFQIEPGVIDYVRRPPALINASDIFALYVEGTSMEPQYFPGDLIYVHPHKPARFGDAVVICTRNGEHEPFEATIGIYRRRTEKQITIGKHNPPSEVHFNRDRQIDIFKILSMNELFGV